jgi:hypothetical protein
MKHAAGAQAWIDRCYLPLLVGIAVAVRRPRIDNEDTHIVLAGGKRIAVARDVSAAVLHSVRPGELLCLRLNAGVAVAVDFADGRLPVVSAQLASAARSARVRYAAAGTIS